MEKPALFESRREFGYFVLIAAVLLAVHLGWRYAQYREFVAKPFFFTHANVLLSYPKQKEHRSYQVLKLHTDEGLQLYTTTHRQTSLQGKRIRIELFPDERIGFWDFLGTFYAKSRIRRVDDMPSTLQTKLKDGVRAQHRDPMLQALYGALFFADPIPQVLREKVSLLGVSHLIALSGFHLGILWFLVYEGMLMLYRPLQQRFFPYRFALLDAGLVTLAVLGMYLYITGMPPSLLRAYAMVALGWLMLVLGVELVSFYFLAAVLTLLVVFFPALLVSLGFWFSVAGVFYIFLLLHYTKTLPAWVMTLFVIPLGIFVLMLPVVHTVFPVTAASQLLSVLLSLLFIPFYPAAMLLHLIGAGELFDTALHQLLTWGTPATDHQLPLWAGTVYLLLSFTAIRYRYAFYLLFGVAAVYGMYIFVNV